MVGQLEFVENPVHDRLAVRLAGIRRKAQASSIIERLADRQLAMHHVVLGHDTDARPQRRVLGVHVVAVESHLAGGRLMTPPTILISVDFPAPDGPMTAVKAPGRAVNDTEDKS